MEKKTGEAQAHYRSVPKVSEAPDPPMTLSGGGYCPLSNTPARFDHWNRIPALDQYQIAYLSLGWEPESQLIGGAKQEYKDLLQLIETSRDVGSFIKHINPWKSPRKYLVTEAIEWLHAVEKDLPDAWQPAKLKLPDDTKNPDIEQSIDVLRYKDTLAVSKKMRSSNRIETPNSLVKDVLPHMLDLHRQAGRFSNCFDKYSDDFDGLANAIRRGGRKLGHKYGSPLRNTDYLAIPDLSKMAD